MKAREKRRILSLLMSVVMIVSILVTITPIKVSAATGPTYYIDSTSGNDSNAGTSLTTPWKTLEKVNSTTFQSGDTICFKAGGSWIGTLYPKGSGTSVNPITIDMYGIGSKPLINGNGKVFSTADSIDSAVYLKNQDYWTIRNLEVVNDSTVVGDRSGIHIDASSGNHTGFTIENCSVHNVASNGNDGEHARISAITVWSRGWNQALSKVVIQNNFVYTTGSTGIFVDGEKWAGPTTGVYVANNSLYDIGGDGILVNAIDSPLVEYNVVNGSHVRSSAYCVALWPFECDNAVFQYNEAYNTKTTNDGQGIDADFMCHNTILQYNYIHDNEGGFVLIPNTQNYQGKPGFNDGTIIRYNIAQNNSGKQFAFSTNPTNTSIYNNTIYVKQGISASMISTWSEDGKAYPSNTHFYNNIFYNLGSNGSYNMGTATGTEFDYNVFYGIHPTSEPVDAHKLTSDPLIGNPGLARTGLDSCTVYQLMAGSPCLNSGKVISFNGGKDFFGNAVSLTETPNRGAYNGLGLTVVPTPKPLPIPVNLIKNPSFETGTISPWVTWGSTVTDVSNTNAHSGGYSLKVTGSGGAVEQVIGNLYPGTAYELTGCVQVDSNQTILLGVKEYGGAEASVAMSSLDYSSRTINFTTGPNSTSAKVFLYKTSGTGSVYCDDIQLIQVGETPVTNPTTPPTLVLGSNDEFNSTSLNSQWIWEREDSSKWSLSEKSGYIRIVSQKGDICGAGADARNILLTGAPAGDWSIETKMEGKPTSNWSQGGLIILQDDNNFMRITRLFDSYSGGNVFQITKEIDGIREYVNIPDLVASTDIYLRMTKNGDDYRGYYSADGANYTQISVTQTAGFSNIGVGLICTNGTGLTGDFDYFHIAEGIKYSEGITLKNIAVDGNNITDFNTNVTEYNKILPSGTTTPPIVTVETTDLNATAVVTQVNSVKGTATIVVTSADGTTTLIYKINFTVAEGTPAPAPEPVNLALHQPVTVDSTYIVNGITYSASNAVDGNIGIDNTTRWCSTNDSNSHWIYVDLGSKKNINEVKFWIGSLGYNNPLSNYKIQVSDDAIAWTDVVSKTGNTNPIIDDVFTPVTTRYVKLFNASGMIRLFEIMVFNK